MARPPRKTIDYFPHLIGDGKKSFFIEQKYGNDGYATWFKILETLAKTEDHWLNLNEETEIMFLAARCRISEETLINILNDLSKIGQINSELWESKIIWSDKFIESIEDVYLKRSNNCMNLDSLRSHLLGLGILKGDVKPQTKLNKTKLNKTKLNKRFVFKNRLLEIGVNEPHLSDWLKVRKAKKASNTETALNGFLNECKKANLTPDECVKTCAENSWSGFKSEWLNNNLNQNGNTKEAGNRLIQQLAQTDAWQDA